MSKAFTGRSHPGIVEILDRTQQILDEKFSLVPGGFKVLRHSDDETAAIIERFQRLGVERCGPTHCTGNRQIAAFRDACGDNFVEMGAGKVLSFAIAQSKVGSPQL